MSKYQTLASSEQKPKTEMLLAASASDQNVYFTYICLINDQTPEELKYRCLQSSLYTHVKETQEDTKEDEHIQIGRTRALHELVDANQRPNKDLDIKEKENENHNTSDNASYYPTTSGVNSKETQNDENNLGSNNLNLLKLTKMKWLTEDQEDTIDVRSFSSSSTVSSTSSNCSVDSACKMNSIDEKYLSTILRLDREHNMFGLSNITIVGSNQMRRIRRNYDNNKPVFHQTAIVQICCAKKCCRNKSNTDLPSSLKCGVCRGCCLSCVNTCIRTCPPLSCIEPPCTCTCSKCAKGQCCSKRSCKTPKCLTDCAGTCFGLKVTLHRKPERPPTPKVEITPRARCLQQLPLAARSCHHLPHCIPPSTCFPYLMPCFWPVRSSAPCNTPAVCFHQPPCPPPRWRKPKKAPSKLLPKPESVGSGSPSPGSPGSTSSKIHSPSKSSSKENSGSDSSVKKNIKH